MRVDHADGSAELSEFMPLLRGLDEGDLSEASDVICGVFGDDLTIGYINAPWTAFGRANGAVTVWGPGQRLLDAISGPLRAFYGEQLARVSSTGEAWEHDYECVSAVRFRQFRLRVLALEHGAGLLLTHSIRIERANDRESHPLLPELYRAASGLITQCGHCRRVRRVEPPVEWDWVPELVAHPPHAVSHGVCALCSAYYYGPAPQR